MPVGRLFFEISADTSRQQQSVREAIAAAQDSGVKITRAGQSFVAAFDEALNPAKKLAEQIALLETVGRPASDILKVMGDQIRNASETAQADGQAIDPLVQKYVDLAAGAKSTGFSVESLGKSLGDFARNPVSAAKAGVSWFLDTLGPTVTGLAGVASAAAAAVAAVFKLAKDTADEAIGRFRETGKLARGGLLAEALSRYGGSEGEAAVSRYGQGFNTITEQLLAGTKAAMDAAFRSERTGVLDVLKKAATDITQQVSDIAKPIEDQFTVVSTNIQAAFESAADAAIAELDRILAKIEEIENAAAGIVGDIAAPHPKSWPCPAGERQPRAGRRPAPTSTCAAL